MSTLAIQGPFTLPVAGTDRVERNRLVTVDATGHAKHAAAVDVKIGISQVLLPTSAEVRSRGSNISILPLNHSGIARFTASAAIASGAELGSASDGKVDNSGGLGWVCISTDVTADGDVVLAVPSRT